MQQVPATWRIWLAAARLRTLPLAMASVLTATLIAGVQHHFRPVILIALASTTVLLQIFCNLANDYGDGLRGTDTDRSQAPLRVLAAGWVSPARMRRALACCALLCVASGLWLLALALPALSGLAGRWWLWLLLGALALAAAWAYTAGRKPYGYAGLGDVAVWLFFGWLAVLGGAILYGAAPDLPAAAAANALGLWCAAVLNINNLRDRAGDAAASKRSFPVRFGLNAGRGYHAALLLLAAASWLLWQTRLDLPPAAVMASHGVLAVFYLGHVCDLWRAEQAGQRWRYNRQLAALSLFVLLWVATQTLAWLARAA